MSDVNGTSRAAPAKTGAGGFTDEDRAAYDRYAVAALERIMALNVDPETGHLRCDAERVATNASNIAQAMLDRRMNLFG